MMIAAQQEAEASANNEAYLLMRAQQESMKDEEHRQKKEQLKQEKEQREKREKVYEEVVFDYSQAVTKHPKLFKTKVQHLSDLRLYPDAVHIDGEYFLPKR